jgi:hypothetical protein
MPPAAGINAAVAIRGTPAGSASSSAGELSTAPKQRVDECRRQELKHFATVPAQLIAEAGGNNQTRHSPLP